MQKRLNTSKQLLDVSCKMSAKKKSRFFFYCLLPIVFCLLVSCSKTKQNPPWEYMPNMFDNPAVKAYREPGRLPVEGTLPQNYEAYPYAQAQGDQAGLELKNPLSYTLDNFKKGEKAFNTYCLVCHGPKGLGDGSIVPKFPRPPTLLSDKVRDWSDGRIFHVITTGQNLMPSYASQIKEEEDRWAIVLYVRAIQRAAKPTPADIEAAKQALKEGKF